MEKVLTKLDVKSLTGKNGLVLFFFPRCGSKFCTTEVHQFNTALSKFKDLGYNVVGCSVQSVEENQKFSDEQNLQYPLISDPKHVLTKEYKNLGHLGLPGIANWAKRTVFILDPSGKQKAVIKEKVTTTTCAQDTLDKINELNK